VSDHLSDDASDDVAEGVRRAAFDSEPSSADHPSPDELAKIGDLAAGAGIRRIHVLAWRDLDDVEAGGSEVHIAEIAKRWAAAGLEVTLRTSWAQGKPTDTMRDGYRVIRRAGRHMVFPRAALAELAGRTGPRDVLVEIWNGMPFLSPVWCAGPRVVFMHHIHAEMWDMVLSPGLARAGNFMEHRIAPPLYRRTHVVTLSESSRREMIEELGFHPDRVTVVRPGVDPRYTPGGERFPRPLIVAAGRMAPVKRYDMLIRAAALARKQVPDLELHILGDGYERPTIEAAIDEVGGTDWVALRGYLSEEEKVDLYRRAWVVASASAREGWGMTLTEAAACGTPAVATRIAGHEDAVVDGVSGVLTEGHESDLGTALTSVLSDPHRLKQLGRGALARAGNLTWANTATQVTRVLADEVRRTRRRRVP
jgi:glycosyltransferase involved in cell wall biosynthesis